MKNKLLSKAKEHYLIKVLLLNAIYSQKDRKEMIE